MIGFKQSLIELEHLHDTYTKKGNEFFNGLLSDTIVINIKIDQAAFVIKKQDGKVTFHGRSGRGDINKVKRASMDTYEDAIEHVKQKAKHLPDNIEVFLEHFSDKWKTKVQYKKKPKGNLMISYIVQNGKTILPNDPLNKTIATILEVSPPPVLFEGKLSEKQKLYIKKFVGLSTDERQKHYGETKFLDFIMSMFVTPSELTWLQEGGYEGIVFYFRDSQYAAKVVDPMFTADKQEERTEGMNEFKQTLTDLVHNYLKTDLESVVRTFVKSSDIIETEDVFIEFVSFLTKHMVQNHNNEFKSLDKHEHEQKSRRFSNLTYSLLPQYMKQLSKQHWWVEELFALLINLLQKEKSRINIKQGLTKERKEAINDMVASLRLRGLVK